MTSTADPEHESRREELSRFLRDRRARVQPQSVGITVQRRRRAVGLLREEVAAIAGVSVTWYTWLEQARPTNPSGRVLDGLASALCLDAVERAHLYRLARPDLNPAAEMMASEALTPSLVALLHGLSPNPTYVANARWDVIAWNRPAELVFGGFAQLDSIERNILYRLLFDPGWQKLFAAHKRIVANAVAQFRATTVHLAADPAMVDFVQTLRRKSAAFAGLWEQRDVALPTSLRKTIQHEVAGTLEFDYATLRPDGGARDVRFTIYTPANPDTSQRLSRLLARDSTNNADRFSSQAPSTPDR